MFGPKRANSPPHTPKWVFLSNMSMQCSALLSKLLSSSSRSISPSPPQCLQNQCVHHQYHCTCSTHLSPQCFHLNVFTSPAQHTAPQQLGAPPYSAFLASPLGQAKYIWGTNFVSAFLQLWRCIFDGGWKVWKDLWSYVYRLFIDLHS